MNDARARSDRALLRNPYDPIGGREVRFHDTRLTRAIVRLKRTGKRKSLTTIRGLAARNEAMSQEEKHTKLPWHYEVERDCVYGPAQEAVFQTADSVEGEFSNAEANREFILRAANSHTALVAVADMIERYNLPQTLNAILLCLEQRDISGLRNVAKAGINKAMELSSAARAALEGAKVKP